MDAIVTSRVPVEIKEQGARILKGLGATQSQLVNAAYDYLIATGELPSVKATSEADGYGRLLTAAENAELVESIRECVLPTPDGGWDDLDWHVLAS